MKSVLVFLLGACVVGGAVPAKTAGPAPVEPAVESGAESPELMKAYTQRLNDQGVSFDMVPIPGGTFRMGAPEIEPGSRPDERPVHEVRVEPFWMGRCEVTWEEFEGWQGDTSLPEWRYGKRETLQTVPPDGVTKPSGPYTDMTFGMGHDGFPARAMSQLAAKMYCRWLLLKTGQYYRLPTEAEWEYACRAGSETAYSFGNDETQLDEYGWSARNSDEVYHKVGRLKPNAFGLHDMHGNVAEWVLDRYDTEFYGQPASSSIRSPLCVTTDEEHPRVVRGGSLDDPPERLRSAARLGSTAKWNEQDPSVPPSPWYVIDAPFVGFRVVRPFNRPSDEEIERLRIGPEMPKSPLP